MEPVLFNHIFTALAAGAMVILTGAAYAALFAWSRIHHRPRLMVLAYVAFALLAAAVLTLAKVLHMSGFWALVATAMLIGYFLAPRAIWRLCVDIETTYESEGQPGPPQI